MEGLIFQNNYFATLGDLTESLRLGAPGDPIESGMIKERTRAGLSAARARGRNGGRPEKLTAKELTKAKAMLLDPAITKTEVAKHFSVSRATLDRYLNKN